MNSPIEFKHVHFSYDQENDVVKDVSFSVEKGSYTTLIGHNGSGKSTIAKLMIGLLEKKSGEIKIDGKDMALENLHDIRRQIGIVFQNPDNQFIGATVQDDIAFGLENHQVKTEDMDDIINHFAQQVGMQDFLEHEPTRLSGGQKQRVAIAGVLAMKPDILILDEATSMLDPEGKDEINNLVQELHQENNMTLLSITHDVEEVLRSDHVIVMHNGKVVMDGKPSEIMLDEAKLQSLELDVPSSVKFANALKKVGIDVNDPTNSEGMVKDLCQLLLKK